MNNYTSPEELLAETGWMVYTTMGQSMWPLIRKSPDTILVEKLKNEIQKYDVILFKNDGKYILHRVIGKDDAGYITRGDSMKRCERGIKDENIIGLLTGYTRKGKNVPIESAGYRLYVTLWCKIGVIRKFCLFFRRVLKKIKRIFMRGYCYVY